MEKRRREDLKEILREMGQKMRERLKGVKQETGN